MAMIKKGILKRELRNKENIKIIKMMNILIIINFKNQYSSIENLSSRQGHFSPSPSQNRA